VQWLATHPAGERKTDVATYLRKFLSREMDFYRRAERTSRLLELRNEVIGEKNGSKRVSERKESNVFKWYAHVVRMEDKPWPKPIA
jgi:hypothetical protein